jgi:hypothetical protein
MTFADKEHRGAGGTIRTPFKRHRYRPKLSVRQKAVNKAHARIRARGEHAVATLKTWKLLAKLRCSPSRKTLLDVSSDTGGGSIMRTRCHRATSSDVDEIGFQRGLDPMYRYPSAMTPPNWELDS